jgi:hypothetical protein
MTYVVEDIPLQGLNKGLNWPHARKPVLGLVFEQYRIVKNTRLLVGMHETIQRGRCGENILSGKEESGDCSPRMILL